MNIEEISQILTDPALLADLELLLNAESPKNGILPLCKADALYLQPRLVNNDRFFFVAPNEQGDEEETLFSTQGYLLGFDTIPQEHRGGRSIFKPESLSHRIKLCGGNLPLFLQAIERLHQLYNVATHFLPGRTRYGTEPSPMILASTPIVTKKSRDNEACYPSVPVPHMYGLPSKLTALLSSGKYTFTDDNLVDFRELQVRRLVGSVDTISSMPVAPIMFKVGQLVEATISIRASKGRDGTWFIRPHLHSLLLIGRRGSMKLLEAADMKNKSDKQDGGESSQMPVAQAFPTKRKLDATGHTLRINASMKKLTIGECKFKWGSM